MSIGTGETALIALVGNPNCGKTALFNRLTGARQKVANYAGVTVERKEGSFTLPNGKTIRVLDLPGAYSLAATTPDEAITRDIIMGKRKGESVPSAIVCVVDATNLRLNLRIILELKYLGLPILMALNMMDVAKRRGIQIDVKKLEKELGIPVIETVAVKSGGEKMLVEALKNIQPTQLEPDLDLFTQNSASIEKTQAEVRRIYEACVLIPENSFNISEKIDRWVLHPVLGYILLTSVLFLIFQAVFSWAEPFMNGIEAGVAWTGEQVKVLLPDGMLRSLIVEGVISGVGSVLVFLPQILILFFFILALEESGYLPRAAFLLDRLMGSVGLSGRAFIPLLSSFACAIPGIMATRTIQNPRDRLTTIMIAPLMTCSARLPVYALIIAAFIPDKKVLGPFGLQGIVLFTLYIAGIIGAMLVAFIIKRTFSRTVPHSLMMELPDYHWPNLRNLLIGLWERARIFLSRVGSIILSLMILLWVLSTFPAPLEGATGPAIQYSFAGMLGRFLEHIFAPIGFNWQICIALVPGLAAREVAVGALGTVYALSQTGDELSQTLTPVIAQTWGLATAFSLLAWYVFAPQCIATLGVVKRETNTWRYPLLMMAYLFGLAYFASFITYRLTIMIMGA